MATPGLVVKYLPFLSPHLPPWLGAVMVSQGSTTKLGGGTGPEREQHLADKITCFLGHGMQLAEVAPSLPTRALELCPSHTSRRTTTSILPCCLPSTKVLVGP